MRKVKMEVSASINGESTGKQILDSIIKSVEKDYTITKAVIKDQMCDYSFRVLHGVGIGDKLNAAGSNIVKDDMLDAFADFNVHLACLDDAFKNGNIEFSDIDQMKNHDLTFLYAVTGFEIKGSKEDESIVIIGNKHVSNAGGRIELKTPKVALDNLSSYKWYNELKIVSDTARREVELYKEGKYEVPEVVEEKPDPKQMKIFDAGQEAEIDNEEFENAKV